MTGFKICLCNNSYRAILFSVNAVLYRWKYRMFKKKLLMKVNRMFTGFFLTTIDVLPNEFYILKHINIWIFYFAMWHFRWLGFKSTASTCNPFFYESNFCICIRDNFNMANTSVDGKVFECIFILTKKLLYWACSN